MLLNRVSRLDVRDIGGQKGGTEKCNERKEMREKSKRDFRAEESGSLRSKQSPVKDRERLYMVSWDVPVDGLRLPRSDPVRRRPDGSTVRTTPVTTPSRSEGGS